jgi:hypothetical protein
VALLHAAWTATLKDFSRQQRKGISTMRFIYFGLAFALFAFSASAQNKNDGAAHSSVTVLVNGQPIRGTVLEVDGKHFVAVEDLAQSLRGTIAYSEGQVALTLSQLPPVVLQPSSQPPAPQPTRAAQPPLPAPPANAAQTPAQQVPVLNAQPAEAGSVNGTLTYFFSFHEGNKPDAGSKVWLVKDRIEIPAGQSFVGSSTALGTSSNPEQYNAIKYAVADANGNFELLDVPPGQYTLILQSAHTKGTLKDKRDFFGRGNRSNPRDSNGRVETLSLLVKAGEAADASKDFGPDTGN